MISLKDRYPFRIGTTSFIYPADYFTNAQRLADHVDEVELLFFESQETSLPSHKEIDQLASLIESKSMSYNIHLPIDLDIAQPDPVQREKAAHRYADIIEFAAPLHPTTFTLHLKCKPAQVSAATTLEWQKNAKNGIQCMLAACQCPAQSISVETLDYPFDWLTPIVEPLGLSVCIDVGHIILFEYDLEAALKTFSKYISILHLHGVTDGKDHRSLQWLDEAMRSLITRYLETFTGTVSIEVFSYDKLDSSMIAFAGLMPSNPQEETVSSVTDKRS